MPFQKFFFLIWTHSIRVVIGTWWYRSNIGLVLLFVKQLGKVTFCQFIDAKGFGKVRQPYWYEAQRTDEFDFEHFHGQREDLCAAHNNFWNNSVLAKVLLGEITVIALRIVCHHDTVCMFFREQAFAEIISGIVSLKNPLA